MESVNANSETLIQKLFLQNLLWQVLLIWIIMANNYEWLPCMYNWDVSHENSSCCCHTKKKKAWGTCPAIPLGFKTDYLTLFTFLNVSIHYLYPSKHLGFKPGFLFIYTKNFIQVKKPGLKAKCLVGYEFVYLHLKM